MVIRSRAGMSGPGPNPVYEELTAAAWRAPARTAMPPGDRIAACQGDPSDAEVLAGRYD